MATVTIKNIPDDLYAELKWIAKANRRSINSEIIVCIERQIGSFKPSKEIVLQKARRLRLLTQSHPITENQFNEAKAEERL